VGIYLAGIESEIFVGVKEEYKINVGFLWELDIMAKKKVEEIKAEKRRII
jgi:hypothetical protein